MSLYLGVFDEHREIAGVEVGGYDDFGALRRHIAGQLEAGAAGSRFPTLMLHSDCEGEWTVEECWRLRQEFAQIIREMREQPAQPFPSAWQETAGAGLPPRNALESFVDVDGEILLGQLERLARAALESGRPILFQ